MSAVFKRSFDILVLALAISCLGGDLLVRADEAALADCLEFRESLQLSPELTMDYVVNLADSQDTSDLPQGILSAKVTYEGFGWVSVGFTPGPASMVPAEAIIGLPDEPQGINNPGKYTMSDRTVQGVSLLPESQQTLMNATITQTDSATILTFQKLLVEPNEIPIDGNGLTTFLWANGFGNSLTTHKGRGAVGLTLRPCNVAGYQAGTGQDANVIETPGTYQSLWTAHGVLAGVAWGIMVPLAISSALLRDLIIPKPHWFKIHMFLNLGAAVLTLVAFILAVVAQDKGTVPGESPNHFSGLAHKTVGLVIMIFVTLQVVAGYKRPHVPQKAASDEEAGPDEAPKKTTLRRAWEVSHKVFGFGLLGTALWQVQDGLSLYASRFGTTDLSIVLWIVFAVIGATTLILYGYGKCTARKEEPTEHLEEHASETSFSDEPARDKTHEKEEPTEHLGVHVSETTFNDESAVEISREMSQV